MGTSGAEYLKENKQKGQSPGIRHGGIWGCVLPWWLSDKESACQFRKLRFDPWVRKTPSKGHGNPPQYSCLENPMDKGAWWAIQSIGLQRV